ncbi:hypothetical protein QN277_006926 [Acacia crassicarpa]|uniref:Uncharacterized protein n=1 Tax=Acacia crassicarpa TaxID=499986 RepID=A0AAE1IVX9_9FABA|nr:hypothetical protein QN277_006926 [Acacia crassicarpa]
MFPSNPFPFDSNLNSTQQQSLLPPAPSFSFLHFPPPSFEDNEIFLPQPPNHHHDHLLPNHHQSQPLAEAAGMAIPSKNEQIPATMRNKRICKRDRHSKIKTAKGLRDRRMRLSLEVAKRFFGLQDILGFDKASKTVEWLLNQSKDEIKQLAIDKNYNNYCSGISGGVVKSASSTSECEGVSGLDDVALSGMNQEQEGDQQRPLLVTKRRTRNARKSALLLDPLIARESREKARERARERTKQKQKMKMKGEKVNNPTVGVNMAEAAEDEPSSQANEDDDSLAVNMIFNSLNTSSTVVQDHHQFVEFQSLAKLWEACYNHMI